MTLETSKTGNDFSVCSLNFPVSSFIFSIGRKS